MAPQPGVYSLSFLQRDPKSSHQMHSKDVGSDICAAGEKCLSLKSRINKLQRNHLSRWKYISRVKRFLRGRAIELIFSAENPQRVVTYLSTGLKKGPLKALMLSNFDITQPVCKLNFRPIRSILNKASTNGYCGHQILRPLVQYLCVNHKLQPLS